MNSKITEREVKSRSGWLMLAVSILSIIVGIAVTIYGIVISEEIPTLTG